MNEYFEIKDIGSEKEVPFESQKPTLSHQVNFSERP